LVADHEKVLRQLKTVRGQLDGLIKMVEDDRYCIDISNQIMASQAILRNVNREVLHAHLKSCAKEAFLSGDAEEAQRKLDEIVDVVDKLSK
jgi:DNA-binding FrmR family transcriptional regulator